MAFKITLGNTLAAYSPKETATLKTPEGYVLPDFLIVGTARGGTTSLARYLNEHPDIYVPGPEVHFFNSDENWEKGPSGYAKFFAGVGDGKRVGDKTPRYSICSLDSRYHPPLPRRIATMLPDAKLIWCLRNPVDRAHSLYWLRASGGRQQRPFGNSFERALEREYRRGAIPSTDILGWGMYAQQIRSFLDVFPLEQMHFIISERLFRDTCATVRDAYEFLDVDPTFEGQQIYRAFSSRKQIARPLFFQWLLRKVAYKKHYHVYRKLRDLNERILSRPRPEIRPETRQWLEEFYKPHNEELAQLLGLDLAEWRGT